MERGPIAKIDLDSIAYNFRTVKKITRNRAVIAVVKADAYGHGAVEVSKLLIRQGAAYLAVAYTSEAVALRKSGIKAPVIVLFDKNDIKDYFKYNLIPVISDIRTAEEFSREAKRRKVPVDVHLKIDTGMGRLGFGMKDIEEKAGAIAGMRNVRVAGLMSHFSDADLSDRSYARSQIDRFTRIRTVLGAKGIRPDLCHMANSAAVMSLPESYFDAVRPGLMLYGNSPLQLLAGSDKPSAKLKPAMTLKTKILALRRLGKGTPVSYGRTFITARESLIAVLPVGYADGYSRSLSNKTEVLVRGRRAPVAGRVCMDTTMADVTEIRGVAEGDEVVLLGRQKDEIITASELASKAGTIPYEILTSLGIKARKEYSKRR